MSPTQIEPARFLRQVIVCRPNCFRSPRRFSESWARSPRPRTQRACLDWDSQCCARNDLGSAKSGRRDSNGCRSVPLQARHGFDRVVSGFARAERGGPAKAKVFVRGEVRLELGAEGAAVDEKGGVDYTSTSVNTTLTAAPGESFVLGSLIEGSASRRRDGRSFSTRSDRRQQRLLITVDLVSP